MYDDQATDIHCDSSNIKAVSYTHLYSLLGKFKFLYIYIATVQISDVLSIEYKNLNIPNKL